jgi:hypothetical protein
VGTGAGTGPHKARWTERAAGEPTTRSSRLTTESVKGLPPAEQHRYGRPGASDPPPIATPASSQSRIGCRALQRHRPSKRHSCPDRERHGVVARIAGFINASHHA